MDDNTFSGPMIHIGSVRNRNDEFSSAHSEWCVERNNDITSAPIQVNQEQEYSCQVPGSRLTATKGLED